ncbi:MAG: diguanylate cyclase [Rubrivivax sp.]|nr:diguanylate cyclase [Rubrivivax sp.]
MTPSLLPSRRNFTRSLVVGVVLLNLVVIALAAFAIYQDKLEHDGRTRITTENTSLLIEREASAVLDRVDLALHSVIHEVEHRIADGPVDETHLNDFLRGHQSHVPEVASLRLTDANGVVRYGQGVQSGTVIDLSDRDFFVLQRGNPGAGLVVGRPTMARIGKDWVLPLSRRMNLPSGEFTGIVYIDIPIEYFVNAFSALNLGSHGLVALRSVDHVSVARYPVAESGGGGSIGQFALSDQLRQLLLGHPSSVTYIAPSPTDGIERTHSYRKLARYPLYVVVGLARRDTLDEWWRRTSQTAAVVFLFSLMTALFGGLVLRSWRSKLAAAEALQESEQRWGMALEGGSFSVWDWNLETGDVQLSKLGKKLFGFADDEIGDHITEWEPRCHPDDKAQVLAAMKGHLRGRTHNFDAEFRVRCKDGSWKWIRTRGIVVRRDAQGKPLRMIGTHTDISERRRREDELRMSAAVFNLADEAMVVTGPQDEIVSVNPAFTAITGYTAEEVIGRNPRLLSAKTHSKDFYLELWATLMETGQWSGEVLNRKKSGEVYVGWLSIKRVLDDKGQLTHHVAVFSDITARKAAEDRIRHLALHDALTDLPNRTLLTERLEQAIVHARRNMSHLGLMYFDLDKFKPVNDSFGHEVGDLLLKAVARRASACLRASDTVGRIGGDEFVVLLPTLDEGKDALVVAENIRAALSQAFQVAGHTLNVSASIGLTIYPDHGADEQELTRNADAAMYQAKKCGRNRVVLYQVGMQNVNR